jgi:hypothetical protein
MIGLENEEENRSEKKTTKNLENENEVMNGLGNEKENEKEITNGLGSESAILILSLFHRSIDPLGGPSCSKYSSWLCLPYL